MHGNATLKYINTHPRTQRTWSAAASTVWDGICCSDKNQGMCGTAQVANRAQAQPGGPGARLSPGALVLDQLLREAGVDQQVLQVGVLAVRFPDLVQELRADDAAALCARVCPASRAALVYLVCKG